VLPTVPVLPTPNNAKTFKVAIDPSDVAVGGVLLKEDNKRIERYIAFSFRKAK